MDFMSREKIGNFSNMDMITHLPENVVDEIVTKLPLRDAVRMSVLSSNWRYKWTNISQLVFEDRSSIATPQFASSIDHVLLLHNSPIHKFKLSVTRRPSSSSIDRWLLFLSRKNVKELTLEFPYNECYDLPSSLFSYQFIRTLELSTCALKLPIAITGFSNLTSLKLVRFSCANGVLECLISKCPLLETLWLECFSLGHIKICAPKLKTIHIMSCPFDDICFENVPLLSVVCILYRKGEQQRRTFILLKYLPNIRTLLLNMQFVQLVDGCGIPLKPLAIWQHLHVLGLVVNLQDKNEIMTSLCIINSAPNLRELKIRALNKMMSSGMDDIWKAQSYPHCNMNQLKVVHMLCIKGIPAELEFIKFVATNSPKLEMLSIRSWRIEVSESELLKTLLSFRRASPKAEINYQMML